MSGRGRGGRGRGGRGGAPTSQARLLLQESAKSAGLDERSALSMLKPAHYPDMIWHSSGRYLTEDEETAYKVAQLKNTTPELQFTRRTTGMTFLVRKQRHLLDTFRDSVQHVQHVPPHLDIPRYRDNNNNNNNGGSTTTNNKPNDKTTADRPDIAVRLALGKLASTEFLPQELLGTAKDRKKKRKRRHRNADGTLVDLDEFEKKERKGASVENDDSRDEEDDSDSDEDRLGIADDALDEDEEEDDDNRDYTTNYYKSDDESDGGGDGGEPTF